MDRDEFLQMLRAEPGVRFADVLPDELFDRIVAEESTVTGAMGNMPIINTGLKDCIDRNTRFAIFDDGTIHHPDVRTMRMLDDLGREVGHSLRRSEMEEFMKRDDVVFISNDFVMYPEREIVGSVSMELLSHPFRGKSGWIPEGMRPAMWYPASTSSEMLFRWFDQPCDGNGCAILAVDL